MRYHIFIFVFLSFFSCIKNPQKIQETDLLSISVSPDKVLFGQNLQIALFNQDVDTINVLVKCNTYLRLYFQMFENGEWSDTLEVFYPIRCVVKVYPMAPQAEASFSFSTYFLPKPGQFRLLVPYLRGRERAFQYAMSQPFTVLAPIK